MHDSDSIACRLCASRAPGARVGAYLRCADCGCFYLVETPPGPSNARFEGGSAAHCEAADLARVGYFERRLAQALCHVPGGAVGRLVDVGCGAGILLGLAADKGWQVAGIELSSDLAARVRARVPSAQVMIGDATAIRQWPWPGQAEVVVLLDVIEHVADPGALLARCRAGLRRGGTLLLQTPNARSLRARRQGARWPMLDPEQHLVLFSPRELRRALEGAGFAVLDCRTVSGTGTETGAARLVAATKERLLAAAGLGNGLLAIGRAR
ncbi:MAG: class I SAM-dependent methyltransferase [bacterium]|nr:class I SAM-dependent methyltransferase [bacterium]